MRNMMFLGSPVLHIIVFLWHPDKKNNSLYRRKLMIDPARLNFVHKMYCRLTRNWLKPSVSVWVFEWTVQYILTKLVNTYLYWFYWIRVNYRHLTGWQQKNIKKSWLSHLLWNLVQYMRIAKLIIKLNNPSIFITSI